MADTHKGKVKFFNAEKGFGFILSPSVEGDVFVHHTAIKMQGYRELQKGQDVEFEIMRDERGYKALNVVPVQAVSG